MYPIPPNETLVETKICKHCSASFPITDKDLEFYEKVSPVFPRPPLEGGIQGGSVLETMNPQSSTNSDSLAKGALKKYLIPPPTLCPDCRQQRRLSFRNERKLYKRKCDATAKDIISIYSPDKPFKVYHQDYWWGDKWDPLDFGRSFDFKKPFFEQFGELIQDVPKQSICGFGNRNCEFTNYLGNCRDCYLTVAGVENENVMYSYWISSSKDCIDSSLCQKSEYLYGSLECINCSHCYFCKNCIDCNYCFFSEDLVGKSYYWKNKKCTQEEIQELLRQSCEMSFPKVIKKNLEISNSQDSFGDHLVNCFDCVHCFDIENSEHCSFGYFGFNMLESRDFDYDSGSEFIYQSHTGYRNKLSGFLLYGNELLDSYYCGDCFSSSHLFGCAGLRNKSYCILNRQYTREEYELLVPKIIEHMSSPHPSPKGEGVGKRDNSPSLEERGLGGEVEWGEFFPSSLSPFGYNETVAQEYYPITTSSLTLLPQGEGNETFREAVIRSPSPLGEGLRVRWSLYEPPFPKVEKIIPANKLPDNIKDIPDDILNWAIECEVTKKPFRIIKQELEFYRKHNLPIPRRHPDQRHLDRIAMRNPRKLFERLCDCSGCEENNRSKGIILKEGENAGYQNPPDSSQKQTNPPPFQGGLRKKIITTYSPDKKEIVYCEECYDKEVVG